MFSKEDSLKEEGQILFEVKAEKASLLEKLEVLEELVQYFDISFIFRYILTIFHKKFSYWSSLDEILSIDIRNVI